MSDDEYKELEASIVNPELRFGYVADIYHSITGTKAQNQLDLLNTWFGELIVKERESSGDKKVKPEYNDVERIIYATRYHDYIYSSGDLRVTYIIGKLTGTASSNLEKERKNSELIQKRIARELADQVEPMIHLYDHVGEMLSNLTEDQLGLFYQKLMVYILKTADAHYEKDEYSRDNELFAFDDEVFDQIIYNAFFRLYTMEDDPQNLIDAYLWLLLGSLLRNECGRLCRVYDSSFVPLNRAPSETGTLSDKLNYLMYPEEYEDVYYGEMDDSRFPGIEWYCDNCKEHLNDQEGFDDHLPVWQCRACGWLNIIDDSQIYDSEEYAINKIHTKQKKPRGEAIDIGLDRLKRRVHK